MPELLRQNKTVGYGIIEDKADSSQDWLTDRLIRSQLESVEGLFTSIRQLVDARLPKQIDRDTTAYPVGFCGDIRDETMRVLGALMDDERYASLEGLAALKAFHSHGGKIKEFWGIDSGVYFQNAIQLGTTVVDVANDTVDTEDPPVVIYEDLNACPIKNITDFAELARVKESYWGCEIYVNDVFPILAPIYPFIVFRPETGEYYFSDDLEYVAWTAIYHGRVASVFEKSHEFLFDSPFANKVLPPAARAKLAETEHPHNRCIAKAINSGALTKPLKRVFEQVASSDSPEEMFHFLRDLAHDCGVNTVLLKRKQVT